MARFFVPQRSFHDGGGSVEGGELVHLRRVLRLAAGDRIIIFDDTGREHEAVIRELADEKCEFEILRSWNSRSESPLQAILAVGLTKGEKMDFVVEKATELGAHQIAPFTSEHSVPQWNDRKVEARAARWNKIALAAVKQCGRARVPEILPLRDFQALIAADWKTALKLFFWERERARSLQAVQRASARPEKVLLVVGPEGGFSAAEALAAESHGFQRAHLGPRTLRAETAAITALGLVQFLWGDGA